MANQRNFLKTLNTPLLLIGLIILSYSCNSKESARITIDIPEFADFSGHIEEQRVAGAKFMDSLHFSTKGRSSYKLDLDQPSFYNIRLKNNTAIFLLIHPNDKIKISRENDYFKISGSDDSPKLQLLYDSLYQFRSDINKLKAEYKTAKPEDLGMISKKYSKRFDNYKRFSKQFILDNLNSMVSLAALYQETASGEKVFGTNRDLQFYKLVNDSLSHYYPKHRHILVLKRDFKNLMDSYNVEKLLASAGTINEGLPALNLPNIKGDSIALNGMSKQYILLNFWTTKVVSNSRFFPDLKKLHKMYSQKGFDIYNVYVGNSVESWEKMLNFEEIQAFTNVADTSFPFSRTKVAYNITALPSNYLLDIKTQEILGKDLSYQQLNQSLAIKLNK